MEFSDGLNVIAGASDTGKSYALSCIDFALGASRSPRPIKEAHGYQFVFPKISERSGQRSFEIRRSLAGGDATLRTLAG
ncbi:MAG: AAA family ATPase [Flavobacteriales bacterium]|nr:AAA family ATPase [Flavobacteriales bacterium]